MLAYRNLLILFIFITIPILFPNKVLAHWIQTHQKVTNISRDAIFKTGRYEAIVKFLDTSVVDKGIKKTFYRLLMEGLRDADLRTGGLYKVDCHEWNPCWDWDLKKNDSNCYPNMLLANEPDRCNNLKNWPVGDHFYSPDSGKGQYYQPTDEDYDKYLNRIQLENPKGYAALLELEVIGDRQKLKEILSESSALAMAKEFYKRAQDMWNDTYETHHVDAMYNLGIALHLVQDMSVPHHTKLGGSNHLGYERYCWENTLQKGSLNVAFPGDFSNLDAVGWVMKNARKSKLMDYDPKVSADNSIKIAVSSSAGMIVAFFRSVGYLQISMPWIDVLLGKNSTCNEGSSYVSQPGPEEGKDTYYGTYYIKNGNPDEGEMRYGGWGDAYYDYIQFDITCLPSADEVKNAKIYLYSNLTRPNDPQLDVRIITSNWTEKGVTLYNNPSSIFYKRMDRVVAGWNTIEITNLYKDWKNGVMTNYGIKLSPNYTWESNGGFYSSDYLIDPTIRPKLVIEPID